MENFPALHARVDSLLFLKEEFTKLSRSVQELDVAVKSVQEQDTTRGAEVNSLKATVEAQADQLQRLRDEQNDLEQYSKNANLEIRGLPYKQNENLRERLTQLASQLQLPNFSITGVLAVHRLPGKPEAIPSVLVRFSSVAAKESWSNTRGRLQRHHQSGELSNLFFRDETENCSGRQGLHQRKEI